MKSRKIVMGMIVMGLLLTGCDEDDGSDRFCGSRVGNTEQLVMEFSDMNITDCQNLELEAGDMLEFEIDSEKGQIDISVLTEDGDTFYEECDIPSSSFHIDIEETGVYQVIVIGKDAKGSVSIQKAE